MARKLVNYISYTRKQVFVFMARDASPCVHERKASSKILVAYKLELLLLPQSRVEQRGVVLLSVR